MIKKQGFTLIELLVVVSIIAILSTVVLAALGEARKRAQVTHFIAQVNQIEKAFLATYIQENRNTWWTESELGNPNPTLAEIIAYSSGPMSSFSDYYSQDPPNYLSDAEIFYDNDGDTYTGCGSGSSIWTGVTLTLHSVDWDLVVGADRVFDRDIDGRCGKVRYARQNSTGSGINQVCTSADSQCQLKISLDIDQQF